MGLASRRLWARLRSCSFWADIGQKRVDGGHVRRMLEADFQVGQLGHQFHQIGQKFVQGRIDEADDHRFAVHYPEKAGKILTLKGQQRGQGLAPFHRVVGHDHFLEVGQAVGFKKHVLERHNPMPWAPYSRARRASRG